MAAAGDGLAAGDPKAGRAKALMCQACHGTDGLSVVPDAPNIAGQTENYLLTQLAVTFGFVVLTHVNESVKTFILGNQLLLGMHPCSRPFFLSFFFFSSSFAIPMLTR